MKYARDFLNVQFASFVHFDTMGMCLFFNLNLTIKHYSTTEARKHLSEIVEQVRYLKVIVSVGRRGAEEVLIVPKPQLDENLPISSINAQSPSFEFLRDEPDLYSFADLKKRYV